MTAAHRAAHEANGTMVRVYFPPAAPFLDVEAAFDRIVDAANPSDRDGWDPEISGVSTQRVVSSTDDLLALTYAVSDGRRGGAR